MRRLLAAVLSVAVTALVAIPASAQTGTHSRLTAISGSGSGIVEVAPTAKDEGDFTFDVQGTVAYQRRLL